MKANFYLVVNSSGSVKAVKNRPGLEWNEVSIAVALDLPNALFQKPVLSASITVPDTAVLAPEIETEVADNIQQAIQAATGYQVKLTIADKTE